MEKIADIIESIANEKGLEIEDVKERVIRAIINTAKKIYGENYEYDAVIDNATKTLHLSVSKNHRRRGWRRALGRG